MPDRNMIGKESEASSITLKADSMREFAKGIGETNPIHFDVEAAKAAGFSDIVATPTYPIAFMAETMNPDLFFELGLNLPTIVHGEQEFEYFRPVVAGEKLSIKGKIADIWEKEGRSGLLDFVVIEAAAVEDSGKPVYTSRITLISKRATEEEEED